MSERSPEAVREDIAGALELSKGIVKLVNEAGVPQGKAGVIMEGMNIALSNIMVQLFNLDDMETREDALAKVHTSLSYHINKANEIQKTMFKDKKTEQWH